MLALRDIPDEIWTLAFGCFRGDRDRAFGVLRVAFDGATLDQAAPESGVSRSQLDRDRKLFTRLMGEYKIMRERD
jgi:hypothetical protein